MGGRKTGRRQWRKAEEEEAQRSTKKEKEKVDGGEEARRRGIAGEEQEATAGRCRRGRGRRSAMAVLDLRDGNDGELTKERTREKRGSDGEPTKERTREKRGGDGEPTKERTREKRGGSDILVGEGEEVDGKKRRLDSGGEEEGGDLQWQRWILGMASPLRGHPRTTSSASAPSAPMPSPSRRSSTWCSTACITAAPHTPASLLRPSPSIFTPSPASPAAGAPLTPSSATSSSLSAVCPHTIIELGTFLGASALHMASISRNLSLPSLILCIDGFRG